MLGLSNLLYKKSILLKKILKGKYKLGYVLTKAQLQAKQFFALKTRKKFGIKISNDKLNVLVSSPNTQSRTSRFTIQSYL